ncbi:DUF302 domain-containing protein [Actinomycetospora cinnamomea]|uniref:Uncharacterized protein (DUF302 family) n=1 Tax=Actinomycetospora cinnamomea TaxID=663609 RepID=A0A2U1FRF9_9PSEU|nr:DUF302 domain-containing protein [Actinomycetospora cinnamomea]PVZ14791.1 uncharacterized protein (DUF302 family) [Actinomycetospora cinnamomea]
MSDIAHTVEVDLDHAAAVEAVTAALADQGFGVLSTIDVQATLQAKLGERIDAYTILGACNPALAHAALSANPEVGLLLPCNVTVRRAEGRTIVQAVDPGALLGVAAGTGAELGETASDAGTRLRAALDSLPVAAE